MGSPVIRGPRVEQSASWGKKCNKFLNEVAFHESKAAKSYYWKHMLQYFEDMERSLSEIRRVLRQREPVGRRLDFLLQEFNREANTLGSKSVDSRTSNAAVELKVLIDQIREQVQNLE